MKYISGLPVEKIIRKNRKTVAIEITERGNLLIKAPYHVTLKDIETIIDSHKDWIQQRVKVMRESYRFKSKSFVRGEKFLYLGKLYELDFCPHQRQALTLDTSFCLNPAYKNNAREIFIKWYKDKAIKNFKSRALIYAPLLGVEYNQIKLSSATKRWGSCSTYGNINIVWRLVMAPQSIIDYVIIHELAHLKYMNHSQAFWKLVASVYPEHKKAKQWLQNYGPYLDI